MRTVVLDPGHGGNEPAGKSSPLGYTPPGGRPEKEVTLALAQAVARRLGAGATTLTRDGDTNLTLQERRGRAAGAGAFVSLHASPSGSGRSEVWVHPRAGGASQALAQSVATALGGRVRSDAEMAILHPDGLAADLGAVLVEADTNEIAAMDGLDRLGGAIARGIQGWMGAPSPMGARRAQGYVQPHGQGESYGRRGAAMPARALDRPAGSYGPMNAVRPLTQPNSMACWATCYAMLYNWRNGTSLGPRDAVATVGAEWATAYDTNNGLSWSDFERFARAAGMVAEPAQSYSAEGWIDLLDQNGPYWADHIPGGSGNISHSVVIVGMEYDPGGASRIFYADPATGRFASQDFATWARDYEARVVASAQPWSQVLHW